MRLPLPFILVPGAGWMMVLPLLVRADTVLSSEVVVDSVVVVDDGVTVWSGFTVAGVEVVWRVVVVVVPVWALAE